MKAVIYHADGPMAKNYPPGTYERLFEGFRKNAEKFGLITVHLTVEGHPGWGDENYFYPGDPNDVVYNREIFWIKFLRHAKDDVYWMTEPDSRIIEMWPPLDCDLVMMRRRDTVAINPAWRMCRPRAVRFFEEALTLFDTTRRDWHGDSVAYAEIWKKMGEPGIGRLQYLDLDIELRNYDEYVKTKSRYSRQWKANHKIGLLESEK